MNPSITGDRQARGRRIEMINRSTRMIPFPYIHGLGDGQSRVTVSHPLLGSGLNYSAKVVSDDPDSQVRDTIGLMCRYAQEDSSSPEIQREAQEIQAVCGNENRRGMIQEIWARVQRKIQFLNDEKTSKPLESFFSRTYGEGKPIVEILIRPRDMATIGQRIGDCDDYSMYVASLLIALGIDCSFVTIAGNRNDPNYFSHVYVAAYPDGFNGERIAVDSSHGPYCGWEGKVPGARCAEWKVSGGFGEPTDSIIGQTLSTVLFIGAAVGFVIWALK